MPFAAVTLLLFVGLASLLFAGLDQTPSEVVQKAVHHGCQ